MKAFAPYAKYPTGSLSSAKASDTVLCRPATTRNSEQKFDSVSGRMLTFAQATLRMEEHLPHLQGVVTTGYATSSYATGEA